MRSPDPVEGPRCPENTVRNMGVKSHMLRCRRKEGHIGFHVAVLSYRTIRWLGKDK